MLSFAAFYDCPQEQDRYADKNLRYVQTQAAAVENVSRNKPI